MNIWKVILATVLIFGTGVVTGGLLVKNSVRVRPWAVARPAETNRLVQLSKSEQGRRLDFIMHVQRELDLSPEQRTRIETILQEGQDKIRKLWEQVTPQLRAEIQSVQEQIRAELTPAQRERFEAQMKRYRPAKPPTTPPAQRPRDRTRPPIEGGEGPGDPPPGPPPR